MQILAKEIKFIRDKKLTQQKLIFKNSKGQRLVGNLIDCGKDFIVIHCHGWGSSKDSDTATLLGVKLAKKNISSFCFDFTGFGESEGEEKNVMISGAIDDLKSAVKFVKKLGFKNIGLSGSSFGGSVVMNFTAKNPQIKVIGLKAPVSDYCTRPGIITLKSKKFLLNAKKYSIYPKAKNIKCPTLIIHGDTDEVVPLEQSQKTCQLIPNCHLKVIKGADHNFTDNFDQVINLLVKWFSEFKNEHNKKG